MDVAASPAPTLLLLTRDTELTEAVRQRAAAAGVRVLPGEEGRSAGDRATLALVDPAGVAGLPGPAGMGRPWRGRVPLHLVAHAPVADAVFRVALDAGCRSVLALPDDLDRLATLLADLERARQGPVVTVTGGSGGCGASLLAAALAQRAQPRGATLLVDLDPLGPGLARLLGGSRSSSGISWEDLVGLHGRLGAQELRTSLPSCSGIGVLGWPEDSTAQLTAPLVAEVLAAGSRGHDHVVVDVPRGCPPSLSDVLAGSDLVLVVLDGSVTGVTAAARTLRRWRSAGAALGVVVRAGPGSVAALDVAEVLDVPLIGELRPDRRLREHVDLGLGPVRGRRSSLARISDDVWETMATLGAAR